MAIQDLAQRVATRNCALSIHTEPCQCRSILARCERCGTYDRMWGGEPSDRLCRPCWNHYLAADMRAHASRVEDGRTKTAL